MHAPELTQRMNKAMAAIDAAGVSPSFEDVVWLAGLADKADRPIEYGVPPMYGAPLVHGGVNFWPWTRLAAHWFMTWHPLMEGIDDVQPWLYGMAHYYSEPGDVSLLALSNADAVMDATRAWMDTLPISRRQLADIWERLPEIDNEPDIIHAPGWKPDEDTVLNIYGDIVELCTEFPGTTPTYWRNSISKAESEQIARSVNASRSSGGDSVPLHVRNRAIHSFKAAVLTVIDSHRKEDA